MKELTQKEIEALAFSPLNIPTGKKDKCVKQAKDLLEKQ